MNKQEIKNTIVIMTYWLCNVCVAGFTTGYLTRFGFSNFQIGFIMSVSAVFTILMNDFFDDSLRHLLFYHLKRTVMITYLVCIILCVLFLLHQKADWYTLILFALICSLMTHNQRLINLLCQRQRHQHVLTDGNRPADIGLISYGFSTVAMGYSIRKTNVTIILPLFILFVSVSMILVGVLLKDEKEDEPDISVKVEYHQAINLYKNNRLFALYLLSVSLCAIGSLGALKYLVRVVNYHRGDAFNHSIALMIQTLITIPVSKKSKELLAKYDEETLLLISYIFSFLKIFALLIAPNLYGVYFAMMLSVLGYGIFGFSSAKYTKKLNKQEDYLIAHKMELLAGTFGIGPLVGGIISGLLMQFTSLKIMLLVNSLIIILSILIQLFLRKNTIRM